MWIYWNERKFNYLILTNFMILTNFTIFKNIILFLFNIINFFRKEYIFFCLLSFGKVYPSGALC